MDAKIKKSAVIYIFIFLLLSIGIWFLFDLKKIQNKQVYLNQKIIKAAAEFKATLNGYKMVIDFVENKYFIDPDILKIIYLCMKSPPEKRANCKKTLFKKLKPLYTEMKKYQINYVQLRFPDGTVFFRFHRQQIKESPLKSKKNFIFGENKRITGGFRFPFELYYKNIFLGTGEIIVSYDAIKEELRRIFKGEYRFLVYKDFMLNRVLKEERKSYIQSDISPDFYYVSSGKRNFQIDPEILAEINRKLKEKIKDKVGRFRNFAVDVNVNGDYYVVSFIVIRSMKGEKIGYLVYYEKDNTISLFDETFLIMYASVEFALVAMLGLIITTIKRGEKFRILSEIDTLTGIYNKGKFNRVLDEELKKVRRYKRPLGLILFDIDHFKKINDTYGHQVGDYVLKTVAKIVKDNIRDTDIFARWGGEEFVILAPETDINGLKILAEKLRKAIEDYNFEKVGKVTASFGITEAIPEDTVDSVVRRADEALYAAKERGRNRVEIILPEI
ncbi:diguanylate cyclase (GGDEF) domain-containing protein [Persephonella hydrogeniphila]|uniref:diguanylate cyclase n=1 Tax=Persephonella hydrogeniphila TaxID=198703 RepID=A0A285NCC8_9AQUI|nr:GGDEF domain-containing protein [Persephonella hydrogeniphila]SNZ07164.1 diguanylate cyclase (GGDEF) domain-containing protein [Persephonella hydrogeniphila]